MREEEDTDWFARWEGQLPSPEELMPLSQTLITPGLALAFDIPIPIPTPTNGNPSPSATPHHLHGPPPASPHPPPPPDFDSSASAASGSAGAGLGGDEPARTLKRPRLVWTPQLHKRFVDAVAHLGIKNAVPKTIMQLMSVDGLTRENVASHLQKYRLYLKRMQGLSASGGGGGSAGGGPISASDPATDQLFASAPVPHHFLSRGPVAGPGGAEPFLPYMPVAALQHHQQITAAMQQQQHYHQRHLGHFGSPTGGGGFDHGFLNRAAVSQSGMHQMVGPAPGMGLVQLTPSPAATFVDGLEPAGRGGSGERKVLTLFPTGED